MVPKTLLGLGQAWVQLQVSALGCVRVRLLVRVPVRVREWVLVLVRLLVRLPVRVRVRMLVLYRWRVDGIAVE